MMEKFRDVELLLGVNEFCIFPLPNALNTVGLGVIPNIGHLIFVDFSAEVNLAVFAGELVILVWVNRIFNIKILATAYWTLHFSSPRDFMLYYPC
jgi:hypothetical protein